MRDYLLDIVKHTRGIGNIDAVKVTNGTTVDTIGPTSTGIGN